MISSALLVAVAFLATALIKAKHEARVLRGRCLAHCKCAEQLYRQLAETRAKDGHRRKAAQEADSWRCLLEKLEQDAGQEAEQEARAKVAGYISAAQ